MPVAKSDQIKALAQMRLTVSSVYSFQGSQCYRYVTYWHFYDIKTLKEIVLFSKFMFCFKAFTRPDFMKEGLNKDMYYLQYLQCFLFNLIN